MQIRIRTYLNKKAAVTFAVGRRCQKHHSTRGSRVIPQRSTNLAQPCLTSEIGRDRVNSEWYDRGIQLPVCYHIYSMKSESHQISVGRLCHLAFYNCTQLADCKYEGRLAISSE